MWGSYKGTFDAVAAEPRVTAGAPDPDAVEFTRQRLGIEPDERQSEVLRSEAKRGILNCSRQWGKSTITAAKAVHRAYSRPGSLVLVASPTIRQSGEFLRKTRELVSRLELAARGDGYNKLSVQFPNGSRIVGLPGTENTVRGFSSVSMLLIDEAARVDDGMYRALRPMLAVKGGDLWMMSTPRGKRGFFYETWEHGGPNWTRVKGLATECARISKEFLEEERSQVGMASFQEEFMGEFLDDGGQVFDRDAVERAFDERVRPLRFTGTWPLVNRG